MTILPFSWLTASFRYAQSFAWWFILPLKVLSQLAELFSNLIFLGTVCFFVAIFTGYIPSSKVDSMLTTAGQSLQSHIFPHITTNHATILSNHTSPVVSRPELSVPTGISQKQTPLE